MIEGSDLGLPARFDNSRPVFFGDDGWSVNALAQAQMLAQKNRRTSCFINAGDRHSFNRHTLCGSVIFERMRDRCIGAANRFAAHRFGDKRTTGHEKAETLFICRIEFLLHHIERAEINDKRGVCPFVTQMNATLQFNACA